jgi:hypothetical protein
VENIPVQASLTNLRESFASAFFRVEVLAFLAILWEALAFARGDVEEVFGTLCGVVEQGAILDLTGALASIFVPECIGAAPLRIAFANAVFMVPERSRSAHLGQANALAERLIPVVVSALTFLGHALALTSFVIQEEGISFGIRGALLIHALAFTALCTKVMVFLTSLSVAKHGSF